MESIKMLYTISNLEGKWPEILASLGIDSCYLKNKHGPCPICGGKDRFRFDDKGKGLFFCNQCGSGDGIKLLQLYYGWDFKYALQDIQDAIGEPHINRPIRSHNMLSTKDLCTSDRSKMILKLWEESHPIIPSDPAGQYLVSRGIMLDPCPEAIRIHPQLPYYDDGQLIGYYPAMMAKVSNLSGEIVTIHRTYLTSSGQKAPVSSPKKLMSAIRPGASIGSAIRLLDPINGQLAIAEGIESALSFHILSELPAWATLSALGMKSIQLPDSVTEVIIAVDLDASHTGQKAALNLSARLMEEGRRVKRIFPESIGDDFNDILLEMKK